MSSATSAMMMSQQRVNQKYRPLTHQRGLYAQERLVAEHHSSVNEAARRMAKESNEDRVTLFGFHLGINTPIEDVESLPAFDEKDDVTESTDEEEEEFHREEKERDDESKGDHSVELVRLSILLDTIDLLTTSQLTTVCFLFDVALLLITLNILLYFIILLFLLFLSSPLFLFFL